MDLSPEEEAAFWPLYECYQKELRQINLRLVRLVSRTAFIIGTTR